MSNLIAQIGANVNQAAGAAGDVGSKAGAEIVQTILTSLDVFKNIVLSVIVIVVFYIIGKVIAGRIVRAMQEAQGEALYEDMVILVNRMIIFGALFVGFAVDIQFIFGLDFLQVVGFFGLGISFAFKDLLANLIAGAAIIIQNRFRIGDFIMIGKGGMKGKIMEIQTRVTILKAIDGTEIVIPNSELMTKPVTTFTAHHTRRIDFPIGVSFDTDLEKAKKVALDVIKKKDHVLKHPAPQVIVSKIGASAINLSVRFYIDPQEKEKSWILTKSELVQEVKEAFDREGIEIPFPIQTIRGEISTKKDEM